MVELNGKDIWYDDEVGLMDSSWRYVEKFEESDNYKVYCYLCADKVKKAIKYNKVAEVYLVQFNDKLEGLVVVNGDHECTSDYQDFNLIDLRRSSSKSIK